MLMHNSLGCDVGEYGDASCCSEGGKDLQTTNHGPCWARWTRCTQWKAIVMASWGKLATSQPAQPVKISSAVQSLRICSFMLGHPQGMTQVYNAVVGVWAIVMGGHTAEAGQGKVATSQPAQPVKGSCAAQSIPEPFRACPHPEHDIEMCMQWWGCGPSSWGATQPRQGGSETEQTPSTTTAPCWTARGWCSGAQLPPREICRPPGSCTPSPPSLGAACCSLEVSFFFLFKSHYWDSGSAPAASGG